MMRPYIIGFSLSLALTLEAYVLTRGHNFSAGTTIIILLCLAIAQLFVQLFFFLHLDRAFKAPWSIVVFGFMALVVAILVFGSLWIMRHLDYGHMHSEKSTTEYIRKNEDL